MKIAGWLARCGGAVVSEKADHDCDDEGRGRADGSDVELGCPVEIGCQIHLSPFLREGLNPL